MQGSGGVIGQSLVIAGIDPGHSGALAFIDVHNHTLAIYDMPIIDIGKSSTRNVIRAEAVSLIVGVNKPDIAFLEDVWSRPDEGGKNSFTFGYGAGVLAGVFAGQNIKTERVHPNKWKRELEVTAEKDTSRIKAMRLAPDLADIFKRKMDDGRAEAFLIAIYGIYTLGLKLTKPLTKKDKDNAKFI